MRKNVFTSSIKILIIFLLLLTVFFQKERSQKLMAFVFILWIAATTSIFLFRKLGKLTRKCSTFWGFLKQTSRAVTVAPEHKTGLISPKNLPLCDKETETMLLHIALRITEKLKSAYPQSVWQWQDKPSLQHILNGGTIRILVENMDAYTHADISFDRFGRIHVEPMTIGSFAEHSVGNVDDRLPTSDADVAGKTPLEPSVVDVRVWYELIGQKVLEELITDLNANGHSMLTIKENGDIVINCQKKKVLKATLDSFPEKIYWKELISILEENELKGKISDNSLQVSWI